MFLTVVAVMFVLDYIWTELVMAVSTKSPLYGASLSAAFQGLAAVAIVAYTTDHMLIIASIIGAFAGTYVSMARARNKKEKQLT